MSALPVGATAPDFLLSNHDKQPLRLSELLKEGTHVVVAFYPAAWSGVCGSEMTLYEEMRAEFARLGARVVGISVDNTHAVAAWAEDRGIAFPLLSDFHPHGAVAQAYGVLRDDGLAERALFIVDPEGVIRYSYVSPIAENPGVDRLLEALDAMRDGEGR